MTNAFATKVVSMVANKQLPSNIDIVGFEGVFLDEATADPSLQLLPIEIFKSSIDKVLQYLKDSESGTIATYRHKIMTVGFQAVGKTSLLKSLDVLTGAFQKTSMMGVKKTERALTLQGPVLLIDSDHGVKRMTLDRSFVLDSHSKPLQLLLKCTSKSPSKAIQLKHVLRAQSEASEALSLTTEPLVCDLTLQFEDASVFEDWRKHIAHWVDNQATEGIEATYRSFHAKDEPTMELCQLDFAGQGEYVKHLQSNKHSVFRRYFSTQKHYISARSTFLV